MKKFIAIIFICLFITSCKNFTVTNSSFDSTKKINIIFSAKDDMSSIKDKLKEKTPNVTIVSCGDVIDKHGYDYSAIGRYEFENGTDAFYNYTKVADYKYLACNLSYNGSIKDIFKKTDPYVIVDYDGIKIGYIGVTSPSIKNYLKADCFMEKDNTVVNFYDEAPEVFYDTVQESIDNVKEEGADYVILLSYVGNSIGDGFSSRDLVENLYDVDIVLDGNASESNIQNTIKDINDKDVLFCGFNKHFNGYGVINIQKGEISINYK